MEPPRRRKTQGNVSSALVGVVRRQTVKANFGEKLENVEKSPVAALPGSRVVADNTTT